MIKSRQCIRGLIGDTLFSRPFGPMKKGEKGPGHLHFIEHVSFIARGKVRLSVWSEGQRADGVEPESVTDIESPNFVVVPKDKHHVLEALEDGTEWYCLFSQYDAEEGMPHPFSNRKLGSK